MSIDPKFVELTADVLEIFLLNASFFFIYLFCICFWECPRAGVRGKIYKFVALVCLPAAAIVATTAALLLKTLQLTAAWL